VKPVLREITDKNGGKEWVFSPTAKMILYSIELAKNPGAPMAEICRKAGVDPAMPGRWMAKYRDHYRNWLEEALDAHTDQDAEVLERVGMIQAVQGNFQFWREMARTKGVIKEEQPKKGITVNTDFAQILVAVGGDFNAARAKLLSQARGLEHTDGPGLPSPAERRERDRPGAGAGSVQGGSVEVLDALGADGGQPEHEPAVPAFPK